jgi:general stress protein 26
MKVDDPAVLDVIQRCMVARIATLSSGGRPSINPLYFVYLNGHIWLGTAAWTLAARNVKADPRVSVLFQVEGDRADPRALRVDGRAGVNTDRAVQDIYKRHVTRKYVLTPGGIRHYLMNLRLLLPMHDYHAQSSEKGLPCVIDVIPEQAEFLDDDR